MSFIKCMMCASAVVLMAGCSAKSENRDADDEATVQLDTAGLQGDWRLESWRVDCATTDFSDGRDYVLTFNEPDNTFGLSTDCNRIGGMFDITNDTIRFANVLVTEMACDEMTVEQTMLRLLADTAAYATYSPDTLCFNAPSIGTATFVKSCPTEQ